MKGRPTHLTQSLVLTLALLGACSERVERPRPAVDSLAVLAPQPSPEPQREEFRPGIRFDPSAVAVGARVGELVVESVSSERAMAADSSLVGMARFRGEIQLSGRTLRHPEADSREICFEADSASGARLPRWEGDERRAWFCFENQFDASRLLGPQGSEFDATVVIARFLIHRGLTDQVNSARLVRVVSREGA